MFYTLLRDYLSSILSSFDTISEERRSVLTAIASYLRSADHPKLNFICTHNSRRSHFGQVWAQTAAACYGIKVATYSGGTEATAFHPNAVAALARAGFEVEDPGGPNPKYQVKFGKEANPMICFSKTFDEAPNPTTDFAAIMTCSEAYAECPIVRGASTRIRLFYEDPKIADGTPEEASKYDERCRQIALEMCYAFSLVK